MTRKTDYTNEAQQRLMRLVLVMFGDVVNGYPPSVLAKAVGCAQPVITRDLDNLATAGWAERDEEALTWRLTPRLPQQAVKVFTAVDKAERRAEQARQRFTRSPN